MPLIQSKSKKAFSKNVEKEMDSGKPQDQSLAIAYSVKRKAKKKMASGGSVESGSPTMNYAKGGEISASNEKRPMPEDKHNDSKDISQNDHKRSNGQDGWLDQPTVEQARSNNGRKVLPIKHPRMVASNVVQSRLRDEEDHLQSSAGVNEGPQEQIPKALDEKDAKKHGPDVPALHMKKMFEGGAVSQEASEENHAEHPYEPKDDMEEAPPESEYMADHFARGGEVDPEEEMAIDHAASIAAAIMAKRKFARGGAILSEDSMESDDSDMADLSRNAEEDANMEDKASFDALRKENYSESDALEESSHPEDSNLHSPEHDEIDVHDRSIVSAIRRKMKSKSPISR